MLGGDEHHLDPRVARQGLDERVHGTAEFEVAAEADGEIVESADLALDGQQVGQGLRGMRMRAVAGVDDRYTAVEG